MTFRACGTRRRTNPHPALCAKSPPASVTPSLTPGEKTGGTPTPNTPKNMPRSPAGAQTAPRWHRYAGNTFQPRKRAHSAPQPQKGTPPPHRPKTQPPKTKHTNERTTTNDHTRPPHPPRRIHTLRHPPRPPHSHQRTLQKTQHHTPNTHLPTRHKRNPTTSNPHDRRRKQSPQTPPTTNHLTPKKGTPNVQSLHPHR